MKYDISLPVRRITPTDGQYFFGYYDLQPFDKEEKYHLAHKTTFRDRLQVRGDIAEIGLINIQNGKFEKLAESDAWNFQQGAMLQWHPKHKDEIIYNTLQDSSCVGVVMNINTGHKRYLDRAVANVSPCGKKAVGINMQRLYDFRPGYGYAEPWDAFYYKNHSADDGVFIIDLETGKSELVLSMEEIWNFSGSYFSKDEKMIINHITFNTDGTRFVMLVRNFPPNGGKHMTAAITASSDGSDMYLLSDYGVQSHYYWLDDKKIIIFSDGKELSCSQGFGNTYIMRDQTHEGEMLANGYFWFDNHMSFSPNKKIMVTDTYPGSNDKMRTLYLYHAQKDVIVEIGKFYSFPCSGTDVRCDLHPRWNRCGNKITFDSTHEGFRGIYEINVDEKIFDETM